LMASAMRPGKRKVRKFMITLERVFVAPTRLMKADRRGLVTAFGPAKTALAGPLLFGSQGARRILPKTSSHTSLVTAMERRCYAVLSIARNRQREKAKSSSLGAPSRRACPRNPGLCLALGLPGWRPRSEQRSLGQPPVVKE